MTHFADAESRPGKRIPVDLAQPLVLTIHIPHGDVAVRAVDRPDVHIGLGAPGDAEDPGDDGSGLTIEANDNRIEIRPHPRLGAEWADAGDVDLGAVVGQITKAFRGGSFLSAKPGKAFIGTVDHSWPDVAVDVPRSITGRVEVHAASGDVHIDGFTGDIALHTMSGDLRAVRTAGALELQTASGDLIVEEASCRLTARTASGDVRVASAQSDGFRIKTANGDIAVDALLAGDGPFRAQTASGDVRLTLRRPAAAGEEPAATLVFQTVSGDARVTPPFRKTDRRRWQSGADQRGPRVEVSTVAGDLIAAIVGTEAASVPGPYLAAQPTEAPLPPPVPPTPPVPRAPSDWPRGDGGLATGEADNETVQPTANDDAARLAVLEAVERGEIDVEEAMRRLDATDTVANS